jgi:hypothetical protein
MRLVKWFSFLCLVAECLLSCCSQIDQEESSRMSAAGGESVPESSSVCCIVESDNKPAYFEIYSRKNNKKSQELI